MAAGAAVMVAGMAAVMGVAGMAAVVMVAAGTGAALGAADMAAATVEKTAQSRDPQNEAAVVATSATAAFFPARTGQISMQCPTIRNRRFLHFHTSPPQAHLSLTCFAVGLAKKNAHVACQWVCERPAVG